MDHHQLLPWITLSTEVLGRYPIFELSRSRQRSPLSGREHSFLRLDCPDWVNVIAVTDNGMMVLIEQYRHGTDDMTLEIPGGAVDPGEDPRTSAARELEEETGYLAAELIEIGVVEPNPAFLSNRCWTYLALGCREDGTTHFDPSEEIAVSVAPVRDFARLIDDGAITHSLVICAFDHLQRGIRRGADWTAKLP
ncbi:MAG: NUDIX hydrolase [Candidatus Sulfomarinibacteraceae bacterium]